jgi:nicotinamidase-related amidase
MAIDAGAAPPEEVKQAAGGGAGAANGSEIYILITQCLQNDFFLNLNCRLCLPADAAGKLLIHPLSEKPFSESKSRRTIDAATLRKGPLARLLQATVGQRLRGAGQGTGTLHLVNIRDWHTPGEHYDRERRVYGSHCQAGTWGAEYIDGLTHLLDPDSTRRKIGDTRREDPDFSPEPEPHGSVVVHHVHSGTLFDLESFAFRPSELARVLGEIIKPGNREHVRVAVIGVYTDIKIQIVLQSLRVAYDLENIVVSDSLTASPTLERHLGALDFASKVLGVEVMHGVGDLARFLGSDPGRDEELESSASEVAFADYAQYFRDKQSIISYEDTQLRSYRAQITPRLRRTVRVITFTNGFLIFCGVATLGATVALALIAGFHPGRVPIVFPSLLLGLSVVQTVSLFFNRPVKGLATTLSRESVFRMLLESRSLRLALARQQLTAPQALSAGVGSSYGPDRGDGPDHAGGRFEEAMRRGQLRTALLREQLEVLTNLDKIDFDRLNTFGDIGAEPEHEDGAGRRNRG